STPFNIRAALILWVAEPVIMQLENERGRVVVAGRRTDDNTRCALVVIPEVGGTWALYPHGWDKLGVRLAKADSITMAQAILTVCSE
ncbi:MAG: hypothetical protein LC799_10980, partial [Actinobacteria bacterium]|nr:hypothetical protein [Actinomycetota bacterium]